MLCLGFQRGDDFYIQTKNQTVRCVIQSIDSLTACKVLVENVAMNNIFPITQERSTEIFPNVKVSSGNKSSSEVFHLVFDAPRSIKIDRGDVYRKKNANSAN